MKKKSFGREIDRNMLSKEIMNITPIIEEKVQPTNFSFDKEFGLTEGLLKKSHK